MSLFRASQLDRRAMVYVAIFGTLWGLAEATLGTVLHLLRVPLSGAILGAIGMSIVLIARTLNPQRGSTLLMACIAAVTKMLSFSTVKLGPFLAILMEGLLLESILSFLGTGRLAYTLCAWGISFYPILQSITTKSILFGQSFVPVILDLVDGFSRNIGYQAGWWILGLYITSHVIIAFSAAVISWMLLKKLGTQEITTR